ncbi:MAG: CPBP family intramembrane metalloprotease [Candidatus Omnitrophica bacterium]|jgi:membrane protease YdiL (CAAX protease family)|nr:CPBP family intramembrane metalloprotease [Candidatus Omnitrophota bacterium]
MKISFKEWALFSVIAALGLAVWLKCAYPEFSFVDLSIDKKQALARAEKYLNGKGVVCRGYLRSVIFLANDWADTYLQKTVGPENEEKFLREHGGELFFWRVRFFRQLQKEEYTLEISPKSGDVFFFEHRIDDIESRPDNGKENARAIAEDFLKTNCGLNPRDYDFNEEKAKKLDNRVDYSFSWEKKGVYLPWGQNEGGAKVIIGAVVSGDEVRSFYRNILDIPEKFYRYLDRQLAVGEYVFNFSYIMFIALVVMAIIHTITRLSGIVIATSRKWFIYLAFFLAAVNIAAAFNNLQAVFSNYSTSVSLSSYLGIYFLRSLMNVLFISVIFIIPGMAGESLHQDAPGLRQGNTFFYFIRSTFWGRGMAGNIALGYLIFLIMIGLQAGLFFIGQKYFGVWKQWLKLTQFSSAYIPFLSALAIGLTASFTEEIVFRLFGITWLRKYLRSTLIAVCVSAAIWGFGHTQYAIFPVWFRGIEVTLIGLFLGFIFIKYGLIPLIVAHYLFDVFWAAAAYILGKSPGYLFWGSLTLMLIPLGFAVIAYLLNRPEKAQEIRLALNANQRYNLTVLAVFISRKKEQGMELRQIEAELVGHGWDPGLVEIAMSQI